MSNAKWHSKCRPAPILPIFQPTLAVMVVCPRKGPLGNEVSVMKCVHLHESDPGGCGRCTHYAAAKAGAQDLVGMGWDGRSPPPSGTAGVM